MSTAKISFETFNTLTLNLINVISSIQVRLIELEEFEKQWKELFNHLIPVFGKDVQLHIADQMLLHTFRYDKYHIVYDDLLSLVENEIRSAQSVSQNASFFLVTKPLSYFINYEKSVQYLGDSVDKRDQFEKIFAIEKRKSYNETYQKLFGQNTDPVAAREHLLAKLSILRSELVGLRNLFSHKYQIHIQKKYSESWKGLEFGKTNDLFNILFAIIRDIYLLNTRTHHRGVKATSFKMSIANQIDLILLGSIEECINLFKTHFPHLPYNEARKEYFKSKYFIDKIVAK